MACFSGSSAKAARFRKRRADPSETANFTFIKMSYRDCGTLFEGYP
jgi:hypothetical protein